MDLSREIINSATTALVDGEHPSFAGLQPQFISNNYLQGKRVLVAIQEELQQCQAFYFSVAFITMSGLTPLLGTLQTLAEKGIPGRILTTDYLSFTEPKALGKLSQLDNIELKMYCSDEDPTGFHTKGYIFRKNGCHTIILGSSNLTQRALTVNKEWNAKIVSAEKGSYGQNILSEFEELWQDPKARWYSEVAYDYAVKYQAVANQKRIIRLSDPVDLQAFKLTPNDMQLKFIKNLNALVEEGGRRGLLVSATGTGKTYASAFGIRESGLEAKRVLFLVHREQIARQAKESYTKVFGATKTMGLLSSNSDAFQEDFIFSTIQTMAKPHYYKRFDPQAFDVIVVDEAHRTGAISYLRLFDYFQPKLFLGMTASPERTDDFNVFELFHHNIIHEIRLKEAMEEDLLCPFHYFGITDFMVEQRQADYNEFSYLEDNKRVDYIIEQLDYYDYSGPRVKGLIFCSSNKEAIKLSALFNERGYRTLVLSGKNTQDDRIRAVERLTADSGDLLDYIFTVDIFNEGVDIPEINQVVLLRPTESPIVFVQQLGRGLRKHGDKEYVVILDFIGNYNNNFMIPMALFGDRSYNKDNMRRVVREGNRLIPGASSISFDEISKQRIYQSIDAAKVTDRKIIQESYRNLKYKLGRIPNLMDFDEYGSIDVLRIFENKSYQSYYGFLSKEEKNYNFAGTLSASQVNMLEFVSKLLAPGKKPNEIYFLLALIHGEDPLDAMKTGLESLGIILDQHGIQHSLAILSNNYFRGSARDRFKDSRFILSKKDPMIGPEFKENLKNEVFKSQLMELLDYGLFRYKRDYGKPYEGSPLNLYAKYTYQEVTRLLNWEEEVVAQNIGGYFYDEKTNTLPIFINYHKSENIADTIRYEDRFISNNSLTAISKSGRRLTFKEITRFLQADEKGIRLELFVRKNKEDVGSKEFYYLGRVHPTGLAREVIMHGTDKYSVEIDYQLEVPVREDLYDYIIHE